MNDLLTKEEKFRVNIVAFEDAMIKHPDSLGEDPFPLKHMFGDGIYVREATAPAGTLLISKIQKHNHATFLMKGECSVLSAEGVKRFKAPMSWITKAGTKRVVFCYTETTWATVHHTDKTDLAEINAELYAKTFAEVPQAKDIPPIVYQNQEELSPAHEESKLAFIEMFRSLTERVFANEKPGSWSDWNDVQKALYLSKEYDAFSKSRGYTEEQIKDYKLWVEILNNGDLYGIDTFGVIRDITLKKALENLDKDACELALSSRFQDVELRKGLLCQQ